MTDVVEARGRFPTGQRTIGPITVGPIGLGTLQLSVDGRPSRDRAFETVRAAVECGVTLIDTADAYCLSPDEFNHNERLIADALRACGDEARGVLIATKGGHTRPGGAWEVDGRPAYLREACERSLRALRVDQIDLYQHHRPDPNVPYEASIEALRDLRDAGKIRLVGVSNADVNQIQVALAVLGDGGLASVQNEFSPRMRQTSVELDFCRERGIAYLLYSPLGGIGGGARLGRLHPEFERVAQKHEVSAQQIALAWELTLGPHVIPIPGCSRPENIVACAAAASVALSADDLDILNEKAP